MKAGLYTVRIYDLYGRTVNEFMFEGIEYRASPQNLPDGFYILEIREEEKIVFTTKLISN